MIRNPYPGPDHHRKLISSSQYQSNWLLTFAVILYIDRQNGASTDWGGGHLTAAYYSFIYPKGWKAELGRPGRLTYSGRFTHVSGHPSAQVECRTGKVHRSKPNVLPLCHASCDATNHVGTVPSLVSMVIWVTRVWWTVFSPSGTFSISETSNLIKTVF